MSQVRLAGRIAAVRGARTATAAVVTAPRLSVEATAEAESQPRLDGAPLGRVPRLRLAAEIPAIPTEPTHDVEQVTLALVTARDVRLAKLAVEAVQGVEVPMSPVRP